MPSLLQTAALASVLAVANARDIPDNVRAFRDSLVSQGQCNNILAGGFYSTDGDSGTSAYCGDHLNDYNVVYLQGVNGQFVNMDIDCDGLQHGVGDDGRCNSSSDTQSQTSFKDTVSQYGISDLNAFVHPYVVFGNDGSKPGWKTFDPQSVGVQPLSLMAVVCGDKLIYGVWGDTNGDDGQYPVVGEAAISVGTACFGADAVNGDQAHDANDVLYIAFPGGDAVLNGNSANWGAQSYDDFESSISSLGDQLIGRIGGGGN